MKTKPFALRIFCAILFFTGTFTVPAAEEVAVSWFTPSYADAPAFSVVAGGGPEDSGVIEFPALPPKEGMTAVLRFDARFLTPAGSGWAHLAGIEVNGHVLEGTTQSGTPRLLGRGSVVETTHPREKSVSYWQNDKLLLFFAPPEREDLEERIISEAARAMKYSYYLDVSDVMNYLEIGADDRVESDKPNRIRFLNHLPPTNAAALLSVKNLTIGYVPTAMLADLAGIELRKVSTEKFLDSFALSWGKIHVLPSGALCLQVGQETVGLDSSFSYASRPKMKFNELKAANPAPSGEKDLQISYRKIDRSSGELTIQTGSCRIVRTLAMAKDVIRVKDAVTNLTKEDIGMVCQNEFYFSGVMPDSGWRLNGQTKIVHEDAQGSRNPTVYAKHRDAAVLLLAEDTVSRTLIDTRAAGNVFTLGSVGMGIGAGKTVTLEWTIYAGTKVDYWDFINQIREAWQVNVTVPGPFLFDMKNLPGLVPGLASVTPWFEYADGAFMSRERYAEIARRKIAEFRKTCPGIKLLGMIENNLIPFDASKVPWSKELPLTYSDRKDPRTKYAQYLSPELSRKLDAATPYADSILHDKDGGDMIDNYYVYRHNPFINLMVQPEIGNSRYQNYFDQCDFLMDEIGFDGVYIDQFNPNPLDGRSFDRWDGVSVTLNPDGTIASKFCDYAISGAPARMEIVKYVIGQKHGLVLTNGHPATREEQSSGRLSFCEIEGDKTSNPLNYLDQKPPEVRSQMLSHLASPVVSGLRLFRYQALVTDGKDRRAQILTKSIITTIHNGVLHYYYDPDQPLEGPEAGSFAVADWMFPFTPVELREDVLVGKERTITVVSGKYTIAGKQPPKVGCFNDHGIPQDVSKFQITGKPGAWTVDVKLDNWNEIAVIVVQD